MLKQRRAGGPGKRGRLFFGSRRALPAVRSQGARREGCTPPSLKPRRLRNSLSAGHGRWRSRRLNTADWDTHAHTYSAHTRTRTSGRGPGGLRRAAGRVPEAASAAQCGFRARRPAVVKRRGTPTRPRAEFLFPGLRLKEAAQHTGLRSPLSSPSQLPRNARIPNSSSCPLVSGTEEALACPGVTDPCGPERVTEHG